MPPRDLRPLCALLCALWIGGGAEASEIHDAARAGDLERVTAACDADPARVDLPDDRDCRPIHFAAGAGSVEIIGLLLDRGARLDDIDIDGDTPLHWAAIEGHLAAIEFLLDRGAEINARNHHDDTPLLYAVMRHRYEAVELLVSRGADLELANDYGRTPLLWNTREGGDLQMSQLLLRLGADINARDRYGDTSIVLAAWRGFRVLVDTYLDHGADLEIEGENGRELLGYALGRGLDRLYSELTAGAIAVPVDGDEGSRNLHAAAQGGSRSIVCDLLDRGADIDAVDTFGYTALHCAAVRGRAAVVEELLDRGAAPDERTQSGYSPLNLADRQGHADVAALLTRHGADRSPRRFPELRGPYMGQAPPGGQVSVFAPDIVAMPWGSHSSVSFSRDGRLAAWTAYEVAADSGYGHSTIWTSRREDGCWTAPELASFAAERRGDAPFFAPDGRRLYFISRRPIEPGGRGGKENIWMVVREGDDWGEPQPLPPVINSMRQHWQFSVAANGNLYFNSRTRDAETQGLYVSRFVDDQYTTPEFLKIKGSAPYVAPDESYLLFVQFVENADHIYITFPAAAGGWSEPIDITATVDAEIEGMCPMVSPDEKYLFFIRGHNTIHWVEADFLAELRRQHDE